MIEPSQILIETQIRPPKVAWTMMFSVCNTGLDSHASFVTPEL